MKLSTLPDDYELSDDEWDALDEEWDHITVSEATELLQQIQSGVEHIAKSGHALMLQLQQAYCRKAWEPLGLPDWQAFLDSALGNLRPHFEDAERKYVHALLKAQHMPVRAIAAVTGVGKSTVARDLSTPPDLVPHGTRQHTPKQQVAKVTHCLKEKLHIADRYLEESSSADWSVNPAKARMLLGYIADHRKALDHAEQAIRAVTDA